jgi:bifunctional polynucleotide phosphatase/kinase
MNNKPNPYLINCINNIPNYLQILGELNIKSWYSSSIKFLQQDNLYYYIPNIKPQKYIAAFDIDWTLSYPEKKLFPKDPEDIQLLPNRQEKLERLFKMGYTIVLFTNQKSKSKNQKLERVERIKTIIKKINVPVFAFIATGDDNYRKPNIGMWEKLQQIIPNIKYSFFVGDAMGRPQDFSDSDKLFAINANINYYNPEEFFDHNIVFNLNPRKNMIVLVGAPGTGKSSYVKEYLSPLGFKHVSRDLLGNSKQKFLKAIQQTVQEGLSLVIDATNPKQDEREIYYNIAKKANYQINVLYFVRNGYNWNKLRENPVPTIGYHIYYKNLIPPNKDNTPGNVYLIDESRF